MRAVWYSKRAESSSIHLTALLIWLRECDCASDKNVGLRVEFGMAQLM